MNRISDLKTTCKKLAKEDREKAEKFYYSEILPEVKKIVQERAKNDGFGKYGGIIFTTGLSPEPLILTITALQPDQVFFLCTKESEKCLDSIVGDCSLLPSQYGKAVIERSDGLDVYKKIREQWEEWKNNGITDIAVDITGGTKPMVSGSAIAGAILNVDLLYVVSNFGWLPGKSEPGSERITKIENPYEVFGDLEERYAIELFNSHNYAICSDYFGRLKGLARDPRRFEVKQLLAQGYGAWDTFDFERSYSKLKGSLRESKRFGFSYDGEIEQHLEILKILKKNTKKDLFELLQDEEFSEHLMVDLYCNAERRQEQGRYDDAIIRLYRVVELIAQHRLAKMEIDAGDVDIESLEARYPGISQEFSKHSETLYGTSRGISDKIGLLDACLLLYTLKDELIKDFSQVELIKDYAQVRNTLLPIHRNQLGNENKYKKLKEFTEGWLRSAINNFDELVEKHKFIKL